jgi:hypothetical protein
MSRFSSSSSSTSSDEEAERRRNIAVMVNNRMQLFTMAVQESRRESTRRYIRREREDGHARLWKDYFADAPIYGDYLFRRRFRMRRVLFNRILDAVVSYDQYFQQRQDATRTLCLTPHQKLTAAIRILAYGSAADAVDEYVRIGETTVLETVRRFCFAIVNIFGDQYMRTPTAADVNRLLEENKSRGFPGMLGSLDCMHWPWKNCPAAWHGQYTGHVREPTIILEAVASYDLWFWHAFFGMPGCNNDLNVLNRSNLFNDLLDGRAHPANYTINNHDYHMGYYLADGIYPPLATIVKTYSAPDTRKKKKIAQMQEATRKDVERAFGVLQARFAIVRGPARFWNADSLSYIMKTCIILHNMIVEDEREEGICEYDYDHCHESDIIVPSRDGSTERATRMTRNVELHDRQIHHALRQDLVEHIWSEYGDDD